LQTKQLLLKLPHKVSQETVTNHQMEEVSWPSNEKHLQIETFREEESWFLG